MHGLDTNVLVRFLLADDPIQAKTARSLIEGAVNAGEPLLVGLLTILETEWVLRSSARLDKAAVIETFVSLLETHDLLFEDESVIEQALHNYENGNADFADCLMFARYQRLGCSSTLTFDAKAAKTSGAELIRG